MKETVGGIVFAALTAYEALVLPFSRVSDVFQYPTNAIWGVIYGFGWLGAELFEFLTSRSPYFADLFGFAIWPVIILLITAYVGRGILRSRSRTARNITIIAIASLFPILPQHIISTTWLHYLPFWSVLFKIAY